MENRAAKEILSLVFLSFLLSFHSLSSSMRKKTGRQWLIVREDIRVHEGHHLLPQLRGVTTEEVKQRTLAKRSKGHCIHLHASPTLFAQKLDSLCGTW
jgi:hypothetical protein